MRSILFHFTEEDKSYLPLLKPLLQGRAQVYLDNTIPSTVTEMCMKSMGKGGATVVSTSHTLLKLVCMNTDSNPRLSEYAGSMIRWKDTDFLFVDPLKNLVTVPEGKFILLRFLDKVLAPEKWILEPAFKWELFEPSRRSYLAEFFINADLIAIDIETVRDDPQRSIACVGFCGMQISRGQVTLATVVVPLDSEYNLAFVRLVCNTAGPKVLQNGKYDVAYLMRYGTPIRNYSFDTINLFHSWLSELPKDLGFISAFLIRGYTFHKNEGKTGDRLEYYQYNAKDCYYTLLGCLALLTEIPQYAEKNFLQEFPLVFPCILSEQTGMKYDDAKRLELKARVETDMEVEKKKLGTMVACPTFNPNSPPQTVRLFAVLGSRDVTSSGPAEKDKVANRHPFNKRIIDSITAYREGSKLRGSYFKESIPWLGRCYYALNPHGTDTGRLASRESQYWCGLQIQNIPRDGDEGDVTVKEAFVADDGFFIGEADYSQAESRDTAFISGDTKLIENVTNPTKDFHGLNAAAFFGVPYEQIVKSTPVIDEAGHILEWVHKTIDKALRDLSKKTNHGANYNMGPQVMLDTMGIAKVLKAKELLRLPTHYSPIQVTEYLLKVFGQTYPVLRQDYQEWVKNCVKNTGLLVGATGWTRRCFADPSKNKHALNSYVAHSPQSLNAMTLNKAYLKVFVNVYLPNPKDFKMYAQIHDSILFGYRKGREDLAWQVVEEMRIPLQVTDIFGVTRELIVPADLKGNAERWSDVQSMKRKRAVKQENLEAV